MHPVIEGLMLGILLAVMVGTVFFMLLQSALEGGFQVLPLPWVC